MMDRIPPYTPTDWEPPQPGEPEHGNSALTIVVFVSASLCLASLAWLFL